MQNEYFLTVQEVAKILKVSSKTIRKGIKAGKIQAFRPGMGVRAPFRIALSEIDRIRVMSFEETIKGLKG